MKEWCQNNVARIGAALDRNATAIIAVLALYRLIGLGFGEMQQWDEAIYALRTMAIWQYGALWDQSAFLPDGAYFAAHPPLYVWLSMLWTLFFGTSVWVFRLTSALAAAGSVVILYSIVRNFLSRRHAVLAAAFLAGMPLVTFFSRQGQLDALLMLLMLVSFVAVRRYVEQGGYGALVLSATALGAALMTKMLFALILPAGLLLSALVLEDDLRRRAWRGALLIGVISLPIWLPWMAGWIGVHAHGSVRELFSGSSPLAHTLAGSEGVEKDTGVFYYANQLVVALSFLFPFFVTGLVRGVLRLERPVHAMAAAVVIVYLVALLLMRSSFEAYLVPLAPFAVLLGFSALRVFPEWTPSQQAATVATSLLCTVWSLSLGLRIGVKGLLASLVSLHAPAGGQVFALMTLLAAALVIALLVFVGLRKDAFKGLLEPGLIGFTAVLLCAGCIRIWVTDPGEYTDGAGDATRAALQLRADTIVCVGNGENPQLTWYLGPGTDSTLRGRDRTVLRLEPRTLGADAVMRTLDRMAASGRAAVIFEKDEVAAGQVRSASDVLPKSCTRVFETKRYDVYALGRGGTVPH